MPKIVFLDRDGLAPQIKLPEIRVDSGENIQVQQYPTSTSVQVIERLRNAEIAITNKVVIDDAILDACPSVKHIAVAATGYNIIDMPACHARGVSVSNIPSYANISVPEHAITLMLNLRRQLLAYRQHVAAGEWSKSSAFCLFKEPINDLHESVLGIIGFGELGQATAKLGHALGMRVLYNSRSEKQCDFAQALPLTKLLQQSDVISVHCDLNAQTKNLISTNEFALMQRHAILINTARGGIVDESATARAIETGQIGGLGIDVLEQEPPKPNHPLLMLAHYPNVIVTPHIAWASDSAMQSLANTLIKNIEAYLRGNPHNLVH